MTSFPWFFLASRGRVPAGTIWRVEPRHSDRSAFLWAYTTARAQRQ